MAFFFFLRNQISYVYDLRGTDFKRNYCNTYFFHLSPHPHWNLQKREPVINGLAATELKKKKKLSLQGRGEDLIVSTDVYLGLSRPLIVTLASLALLMSAMCLNIPRISAQWNIWKAQQSFINKYQTFEKPENDVGFKRTQRELDILCQFINIPLYKLSPSLF